MAKQSRSVSAQSASAHPLRPIALYASLAALSSAAFVLYAVRTNHSALPGIAIKTLPALLLTALCARHSTLGKLPALAMLLFALGDALLDVSDLSSLGIIDASFYEASSYSGIGAFVAGQVTLLTALAQSSGTSHSPRSLKWFYGVFGASSYIGFGVFSVLICRCTRILMAFCPIAPAITSVAWAGAAAWLSGPRKGSTGALLVALGAHLFLLSDSIVGLHMFCAWPGTGPTSPADYVLVEMPLYYLAIILEAVGVCWPAAHSIKTKGK